MIWRLKTTAIDLNRPVLMGILNATPDSFSDGGSYRDASCERFRVDLDAIVDAGMRLVRDGASILDVGGESTRPGSEPVDEAEELRRVVPVVRALKKEIGAPISVDTYRPAVADAALESGAEILNDVSAGRCLDSAGRWAGENATDFPEETAKLVARRGAAVGLVHARLETGDPNATVYATGVVPEVLAFLKRRRDAFLSRGVDFERIALDPGFGFGKDFEQNWELFRRLDEFVALGSPVFVGVSRKRFLAETARRYNASRKVEADETVDPNDRQTRDFATALTTVEFARRGATIIRVHNVAASALALSLARHWDEEPAR